MPVAAYQPKGAASLSASYINLANPGTYNAAPGVAPTWNAATGWTFASASSQFLTTGIVPGATGWSALIAVAASTGGGGVGRAFVAQDNTLFAVIPYTAGSYVINNGATLNLSGTDTNMHVLGFAAKNAYKDGVKVGTIPAGNAPAEAILIGNNASLSRGLNGTIKALVFWDVTLTAPQVAAVSTAMAAL